MSFSWRPSASPSTTTPCRCALHQKRCGVTSQTREQSQRRKKSSRSNASRRGQGCPWPLLQHFSKAALHVVSFSSSLIAYRTTAVCVDFDPRTPCTIGRLNSSAKPCVRIMRYGSTTLKSAVVAEWAIHSGSIPLQTALVLIHSAPVGKEAGQGAGRSQKLGYADVFVGSVRHVNVARAVHHAGHLPEADEEPHVRAVGDAFYKRFLPRHPLVGLLYRLTDRGVELDLGGGELAAEPCQLGRVFT